MKKFIAIIAAIALIATMSVAVFADTTKYCDTTKATPDNVAATGIHTDEEKDVWVSLTGEITHVVCVDIAWDDIKFDYSGAMIWDPHAKEYKANGEQGDNVWAIAQGATNVISYTNNSDVPVTIEPSYDGDETTTDVKITFTEAYTKTLDEVKFDTTTGTVTTVDTDSITVDASLVSGTPSVVADDVAVKVGTVTLTITSHEVA